jgi:hypothetical protein
MQSRITMSNFSFPDHCSYCTKEFNVSHCLFPYALIMDLQLPEENENKARYLTKLHHHFRNQIPAMVPSQLTTENLARHEALTNSSAVIRRSLLEPDQFAFYTVALAYYFRYHHQTLAHTPAPTQF